MYVKRVTDVRKKNGLSGNGLFANRPADTVSSLPSDRRLTFFAAYRGSRQVTENPDIYLYRLCLQVLSNLCMSVHLVITHDRDDQRDVYIDR